MRAAWHGLEFRVLDFKDTGTFILGGVDDVQACAPLRCRASRAPLSLPQDIQEEKVLLACFHFHALLNKQSVKDIGHAYIATYRPSACILVTSKNTCRLCWTTSASRRPACARRR